MLGSSVFAVVCSFIMGKIFRGEKSKEQNVCNLSATDG